MAELTRLRDEKEKLYTILQSHLLICPGLNIFWLYVHLYTKLTQRLEICVLCYINFCHLLYHVDIISKRK